MTLAEELDAIEARANDAAPGPWTAEGYRVTFSGKPTCRDMEATARFQAAARTDVPRLVAALREAVVFLRRDAAGMGLDERIDAMLLRILRGEA